ncbi:unnamed protein product [Psylliodes chrysocephalus]|uniref:Uncharacterized protein n=1 Tax=Psylliodes chrysocephalus TaxID=3402493 RepID=A0A9P0GEG7_9CUCU|nr:unnamed protein product [Psylliodes chrysocephala]
MKANILQNITLPNEDSDIEVTNGSFSKVLPIGTIRCIIISENNTSDVKPSTSGVLRSTHSCNSTPASRGNNIKVLKQEVFSHIPSSDEEEEDIREVSTLKETFREERDLIVEKTTREYLTKLHTFIKERRIDSPFDDSDVDPDYNPAENSRKSVKQKKTFFEPTSTLSSEKFRDGVQQALGKQVDLYPNAMKNLYTHYGQDINETNAKPTRKRKKESDRRREADKKREVEKKKREEEKKKEETKKTKSEEKEEEKKKAEEEKKKKEDKIKKNKEDAKRITQSVKPVLLKKTNSGASSSSSAPTEENGQNPTPQGTSSSSLTSETGDSKKTDDRMETDEDTTPEGNNDGFTLVERKKRKNPGNESDSESEDIQNRKRTDTKVVPEENSEKTKDTSKPKPPPIILARAGRWFQLRLGLRDREIRYLSTVYRNGELKIWPETEEDYRRMQKYFIEMEDKFHCFTLKEDKPYKAVIRGIPEDTDLSIIKEELVAQGLNPIKDTNRKLVKQVENLNNQVANLTLQVATLLSLLGDYKNNKNKEENPAEDFITEAMATDLPNSDDEFTEVKSRNTRKRGRKTTASGAGNTSSEEDDPAGSNLTPRTGSKSRRCKSPTFSPARDESIVVKDTVSLGASKGFNLPVNGRASEAFKLPLSNTTKPTAKSPREDFPPLPTPKKPIMTQIPIRTTAPPTQAPGGSKSVEAKANANATGSDEPRNLAAEPKQIKIPPVVVESGAKDWPKIRRGLVERGIPFTKAATRNEELKIWPATSDAYRASTKYLDEIKAKYHTYRLEDEKCHKAVLRGLPKETDIKYIIEDLENQGLKPLRVQRMTARRDRQPLPLKDHLGVVNQLKIDKSKKKIKDTMDLLRNSEDARARALKDKAKAEAESEKQKNEINRLT